MGVKRKFHDIVGYEEKKNRKNFISQDHVKDKIVRNKK